MVMVFGRCGHDCCGRDGFSDYRPTFFPYEPDYEPIRPPTQGRNDVVHLRLTSPRPAAAGVICGRLVPFKRADPAIAAIAVQRPLECAIKQKLKSQSFGRWQFLMGSKKSVAMNLKSFEIIGKYTIRHRKASIFP